jgi:hypothetical protein
MEVTIEQHLLLDLLAEPRILDVFDAEEGYESF